MQTRFIILYHDAPLAEIKKDMDQDMITDVTLDHLPDLSEASVSFQIPTDNPSADLLLADHTGGFDLLCSAIEDDTSFVPAAFRHPRGPPLTLGELTPRVEATSRSPPRSRSSTPIPVPSSSAKPLVTQRTLTLGQRSPDKRRKTPRAKFERRQLESPLVSEERFDQLRTEIETLAQAGEIPSHVQIHEAGLVAHNPVECKSSSPPKPKLKDNTPSGPPAPEDRPESLPGEMEPSRDGGTSAEQDVAMAADDDCSAEAMTVPPAGPQPKSKRNPRTSVKRTVVAGGISKRPIVPATHVSKKTKRKPSRVREAHQAPPFPSAAPQITPPQSIAIDTAEETVPHACIDGDIDFKSENTQITRSSTGGMAERLVSYGQKFISSIGLYRPCPEDSFTEASNDAVRVTTTRVRTQLPTSTLPPSPPPDRIDNIPVVNSEPFRLSEISPSKQPPNVQSSSAATTGMLQQSKHHAMTPMRPSKKRVSMDADLPPEYHRGKKTKTTADTDSDPRSSGETVSQAPPAPTKKASHENQSVTHPETCDKTRHSSSSTLPSARTKYKPKLKISSVCKGPTLDAFPYLSGSRQMHKTMNKDKGKRDAAKTANLQPEPSLSGPSASSRLRQAKKARQGDIIQSFHGRQRSSPISTADFPLIEKQNATLSVAPLTKPVGFTFRVDARLEARKAEERLAASEPAKTHLLRPEPDFKALRASHQAEFVFHREGTVPSLPVVPFVFCTEQRAKEREKFDEMMRRKQEEMGRLREEQRRREAEEEERAIKELRRKAIPKANDIPEWYADMPKRKGTAV